MGVFSKKGKTPEVINPVGDQIDDQNLQATQGNQSQTSTIPQTTDKKPRNSKSKALFLIVFIIFIAVGSMALGYTVYTKYVKQNSKEKVADEKTSSEVDGGELEVTNRALLDNDKDKALAHAKKVLEEAPNDLARIVAVASLSVEQDPDGAKHYYARAFEIFKKDNKLDDASKTQTTSIYWAAAGFAEQAGKASEAVQYYELVIKTANLSDDYEKNIAKESELAIMRLK